MSRSETPDVAAVQAFLLDFQGRACRALEEEDGAACFREDLFAGEGGALARPRVLADGAVIERAAVNFSHAAGRELPGAASARRPEITGATYGAVSVSMIVHPRNPYAPTSHANFRLFVAHRDGGEPVWWFGGGFDLTPYYGFEEDAVEWHEMAKAACDPFGAGLYAEYKKACDEYFYLEHREEPRGIGGLFFDDLSDGGFARCFRFVRGAADRYLAAYRAILARRKLLPYGERERSFQLLRRGRYVEFNLLYDRGTRFGLQSGARVESILAALPPLVAWRYDWQPEPGTPEAELYEKFLRPRDWIGARS
ncbi:MAG: oxygen-dependent coproporphyrinogen oxidase [Deltaproteobacteria bacterium]|nr:oxygen-dependent coproporphyrinogen oxidase [Deltaproteobacteria bacterium]